MRNHYVESAGRKRGDTENMKLRKILLPLIGDITKYHTFICTNDINNTSNKIITKRKNSFDKTQYLFLSFILF